MDASIEGVFLLASFVFVVFPYNGSLRGLLAALDAQQPPSPDFRIVDAGTASY